MANIDPKKIKALAGGPDRKKTLKAAQDAAARGDHAQARALFASVGIGYVPSTSFPRH